MITIPAIVDERAFLRCSRACHLPADFVYQQRVVAKLATGSQCLFQTAISGGRSMITEPLPKTQWENRLRLTFGPHSLTDAEEVPRELAERACRGAVTLLNCLGGTFRVLSCWDLPFSSTTFCTFIYSHMTQIHTLLSWIRFGSSPSTCMPPCSGKVSH